MATPWHLLSDLRVSHRSRVDDEGLKSEGWFAARRRRRQRTRSGRSRTAQSFWRCDYVGRQERMQPLPQLLAAPSSELLAVLESELLITLCSVKRSSTMEARCSLRRGGGHGRQGRRRSCLLEAAAAVERKRGERREGEPPPP